MTQSRLNNILLLHCHKEMSDAIDLTAVAKISLQLMRRERRILEHFCNRYV